MATFPNIVVDPYLVCLPSDCKTVEQLDAFIENLLGWADLLNRDDLSVHFPAECLDALVEAEQYPYHHELKRLVSHLGASHVSVDFVCRVAQHVLDDTHSLEKKCSITFALFDDVSCRIEPDIYITRLAARIGWGLKHGLVVMACYKCHHDPSIEFLLASAKSEPEEAFERGEVHVSANVGAIESPTNAAEWEKILPSQFDESMPVAFGRDSILEQLGHIRLWGNADSEENARYAIDARVLELLASGAGNRGQVREYRFGPQFLESARENAFAARSDLAGILIDSCARILIDVPKQEVKPFRISESSDEQTVRDDGAKALRTHLTKRGPGYRLMLWILSDGVIEFANVGPKKELEID